MILSWDENSQASRRSSPFEASQKANINSWFWFLLYHCLSIMRLLLKSSHKGKIRGTSPDQQQHQRKNFRLFIDSPLCFPQLSVALLTSISSSFPSSANTTLSFSLQYRWRHWGMERKSGSNNTVLREWEPKQAGSKDSPPNQAEPGVERGGAASPKAAWASPLLLLMVLELPTTSLPRDLVSS